MSFFEEGADWPLSCRDPSTSRMVYHAGLDLEAGVASPLGGQSVYGRMDELARILHFLLAGDGRLLRPVTAAVMFEPQLDGASRRALLR
ncbi:uncharacterized protein LY79DRAFT_668267 [Colletotrichum navitas]|uniref:Uncharacterized protein n=1 Tax=Colletotrichum navitas TaxID=681940 RepID=A0AAD8V6Q1_9PEZI|nr:uncharacterized protein LY79DRAFT_668267 [Colletotrichum navitas]KAK1595054.1 hypothetical protein LY79DRAFT_668267 [Colletotrichum navitas]